MFRFRVPALMIAVSIVAAFFLGWRLGYDCFWDFRLLNLFLVLPLVMGIALACGGRLPGTWVAIALLILLMGVCVSTAEFSTGRPRNPPMPIVLTSLYGLAIIPGGVWALCEKERTRRWKLAMVVFFLLAAIHMGWLLRLHVILG